MVVPLALMHQIPLTHRRLSLLHPSTKNYCLFWEKIISLAISEFEYLECRLRMQVSRSTGRYPGRTPLPTILPQTLQAMHQAAKQRCLSMTSYRSRNSGAVGSKTYTPFPSIMYTSGQETDEKRIVQVTIRQEIHPW